MHRPDATQPGLLQPGCRVPGWTQGPQVCLARLAALRPRVSSEFVGSWLCVGGRALQDSPARCHLGTPARPQPGGGGASAGGQTAASPPPSSPIGAKLGEGATPGNRQPTSPSLASCLSFPTRSTPGRTSGARPRPAPQTLAEFKLSLAPLAGARAGPRRAPGTVAATAARGRPRAPLSPPAACVPLPRSGPRASSLLI